MTIISEEQALALAESFIANSPVKRKCGQFSSVKHKPRGTNEMAGTFYVEFAYAGPPVKKGACPPLDHPTIVLVNDCTGACKIMLWL
jgi:hypothetical protein